MRADTQTLRRDEQALRAELETAGAVFKGRRSCTCPFHDDKSPSAGIYEADDGAWKFRCHACGVGGDLFDVRAKITGKPVGEILRDAAPADQPAPARRKPSPAPAADKEVFPSIEVIKHAIPLITDAYRYTDPGTREVDMVVFRRSLSGGKKSFMQARPVDDGFILEAPPKPWPIYNRTRVRQAERVVVVEGEKDVHTLAELGFVATTSPGGAGKAEHADWSPLAGKTVYLWPDADRPDTRGRRAGVAHMRDVHQKLEQLEPQPRVLSIDPDTLGLDDKGDVSDFIQQRPDCDEDHLKAAVEDVLRSAQPLGPAAELRARFADAIAGRRRPIAWPFPKTGELTKALSPGTITLIPAPPGATKSFFVLQSGAYWLEHGHHPAILELEDGRAYHLQRALAQRVGDSRLTDDDWARHNAEQITTHEEREAAFISRFGNCIHTLPGDEQPTFRAIGEWVEKMALSGRRVIVVDPISIAAISEKQYIHDQEFMIRIKRIAEQSETSIVLVVHPRKHPQGISLDDIAGGASYSRLCHTALWLEFHNEPKSVTVRDPIMGLNVQTEINRTLHIIKARNGRGTGKKIGFIFDPDTLLFSERGIIISGDDQ